MCVMCTSYVYLRDTTTGGDGGVLCIGIMHAVSRPLSRNKRYFYYHFYFYFIFFFGPIPGHVRTCRQRRVAALVLAAIPWVPAIARHVVSSLSLIAGGSSPLCGVQVLQVHDNCTRRYIECWHRVMRINDDVGIRCARVSLFFNNTILL